MTHYTSLELCAGQSIVELGGHMLHQKASYRVGKTPALTKLSSGMIPRLLLMIASLALCSLASAQTYYVATNGNDSWNGLFPSPGTGNNGPWQTIAHADASIAPGATVEIESGTYYLPVAPNTGTLVLQSSGTAAAPIIWQNYRTDTPVISGGEPVGKNGLELTWTLVSGTANEYQVQLPANFPPFEYLFYNGERRLRARIHDAAGVGYYMSGGSCISTQTGGEVSPSFCNLGTFLRVAGVVDPNTPLGAGCPSSTSNNIPPQSKCLDRFYYTPPATGDPITNWMNLNGTTVPHQPCETSNSYPAGDVELTLTDAWIVDAMRINCVDTTNHVIYLICPSNGQNCGTASGGGGHFYDFFGPMTNHRYVIENAKDAFLAAYANGQTGLWYLDRAGSGSGSPPTLYYIANSGEDPNNATVVIAVLGGAIPGAPAQDYIGASLLLATNLQYVTFKGLTFEVDNFYPSYDTGFNNDINGEMSLPQAIDCESCQHVTFDTITVKHTSASGILIASSSGDSGQAAQFDTIQNSTFFDLGDSGVRIGHWSRLTDKLGFVVNNVTVQNNLIDGYSRVFADGEGIAQGNGNTISYLHNDIVDGYHAGISVCQLGCPGNASGANGTGMVSMYNHLHDLMQGITDDGGSLYYSIGDAISSGTNNVILNNLVHDTNDSSIIDTIDGERVLGYAYGGEGLYLDAQSANVDVENNVVYRVSGHALHVTDGIAPGQSYNLFENNILSLALRGMFKQAFPWPEGCYSGGPHVSLWWNIFNFDQNETPTAPIHSFYVIGGCTNSCGRDFWQFQDFEGNSYWRAGTPASGPLFCNDPYAFAVINSQPSDGSCTVPTKKNPLVWLSFDLPNGGANTWQHGQPPYPPGPPVNMNEDIGEDATTMPGTCSWNPNFKTTGSPNDYLLTSGPPTPFQISKTNDTIKNAGRTGTFGAPPGVPATFPTYTYASF